jgi:8-oxo-dGTP pyrophosphatase MutT (NUDIX family)
MTSDQKHGVDPTAEPTAQLPFDPEQAPIVDVVREPAIRIDRLTPERVREAFVAPRPWPIEASDESRTPRLRVGATGPVPASVLIPLIVRNEGLTVLLTERTAHLHDHAGQVSFPGGSVEAHDADAIETALRESEEEIGLGRRHVEVIGRLPDYPTITGFMVAQIVALVHPPFDLTLDAFEVAEAFEVPLAFLMDPANHERREIVFDEGVRQFTAMPHGPHFIWGATAAMLRNLYRFLHAQLGDRP